MISWEKCHFNIGHVFSYLKKLHSVILSHKIKAFRTSWLSKLHNYLHMWRWNILLPYGNRSKSLHFINIYYIIDWAGEQDIKIFGLRSWRKECAAFCLHIITRAKYFSFQPYSVNRHILSHDCPSLPFFLFSSLVTV